MASGLDLESPLSVPIVLASNPLEYRGGGRYEWGYAHYRNPLFALPCDLISSKGKRSFEGLLHGVDTLPPRDQVSFAPAHLKTAGYVVLRHRLSDGTVRSIFTNYGSPHHRSHIDLLGVHVSENGRELIGMMGQNSRYGRKGWYSTLADSLLAVNGRDQIVGRGRLVRLEQNEDWAAVEVATDPTTPLYEPAVEYHRLVVSGPDFVVLLDRAHAPQPVALQWAFYPGQDTPAPGGWQPAEHPGLHPGEKQNGPLSPVRRDWLAAPQPAERLCVPAEVRDEPNPTPVTILTAPVQQPYAFSTPGSQKGGWVHALLLHSTEATGAVWAAVLDRSAEKSVQAELVSVLGARGEPLHVGRAAATRVTAPSGTWTLAFGPADISAKVGRHSLTNGWLIQHGSGPPPP